jgi:ribosome-associated protein YbcJ (S4-like RNA binding protein)
VVREERVVLQPLHKLVQVVNQGLMAKEAAQVAEVLFS